MAKKTIAGSGSETKKSKKKSLKKSGPNAKAMKVQAPKENPFETMWTRRKFDFLGKKPKGEERRVGQARSLAIEKRKNTLLKEYEQSRKSSVFLDKRIGERNDDLAEFDKAILRSQRERQIKQKKKTKYNLSDEEEDVFASSGGDDFAEDVEPDDDDGDENRPFTLKHIGTDGAYGSKGADPSEGEETRRKTSKEVYKEIMMKQKFHKAERAKEKEENEEFIGQLDEDFKSLVQSEALSSLAQSGKNNSGKSVASKQEPSDDYDKLMSDLRFERRAQPSDRTKTLEELQEEERERLEQLEQERKERMLPPHDSSDEDDDASDDADGSSSKRSRPISGDDLGDLLSFDEKTVPKKGWVDEILERDAEESDDDNSSGDSDDEGSDDDTDEENEEDDEKAETLKDWEQTDDDLDADLKEDEEGAEIDAENEVKGSEGVIERKTKIRNSDAKKTDSKIQPSEVPSKVEAPSSMEEFLSLLENRTNQEICLVIHRIRVHHPVSQHRKQMQVFYGLLLQFFATLAIKKPFNIELLNMLLKPLMEMSMQIPYFSAICARERITRTRNQFCLDVKDSEKSCWPSLKTLILLRLWSMIYSCSDFRHPVMTPALLLMCEYLMRCSILCGRDVAVGSFLCSMVLTVCKRSQKYCPEALVFLRALLLSALDKDPKCHNDYQRFFRIPTFKAPRALLCLRQNVKEVHPLNFLKIMDLPEDSAFFSTDDFRATIITSALDCLMGFVEIYRDLKAFPEIFLPVSALLLEVAEQPILPDFLVKKLRELSEIIMTRADEHHSFRQPLQMRKQRPEPIRTLRPSVEENYVKGRDYDPDRERAEQKKLKKLVKQERKGAIREIRKDSYFLQDVKAKERAQQEAERAEKRGKDLAFLQEQEHAAKSGQLGKRRRGRK